jgi:mRNA deadenylase 3'-5' endonuclease subunit Ccr4
LILHEILAYQADIICLQEVDELVYDTLFRPVLEHLNYQGYFSVKQSNGTREGSAIFWSLKRFQRASAEDRMTFGLSQLLNQYVTPLEEGCEWKECADTVRKLFHTRPDLEDTIQKRLGHTLMVSASCVIFFTRIVTHYLFFLYSRLPVFET